MERTDVTKLPFVLFILKIMTIFCFLMTSASKPVLELEYANTQIWHLDFINRFLPRYDTFAYIKRHTASEMSLLTLNESENIPWAKLAIQKTVLLHFRCEGGYHNQKTTSEIERGYLGMHLRFLRFFGLSGCPVRTLTAQSFEGLTRLAVLNITSKHLVHLSVGIFTPLKDIVWIRMSGCSVKTLSSDWFCENSKLSIISFSDNNISEIVGRKCRNSLNNPTVNSLTLQGNNIRDITHVDFQYFRLNGIFSLSNCSINLITKQVIDGLSDILTLDLSFNQIQNITDDAFTALNKSLMYVKLSSNRLTQLNINKTFGGLQLETLHLDSNNISLITGRMSLIKSLKHLDLQHNKLQKMTMETFGNMSNLLTGNLTYNVIEYIEYGIFDDSRNLEILDLNNNRIKRLPDNIFRNAQSLSKVYLYSNNLEQIDEHIFENCTKIEWIEIQHNQLKNLSKLVFTSDKIRFIKIEYNSLTTLPMFTKPGKNACESFPSLTQIKARNNRISFADTSCLTSLENLDLGNNYIKSIDNFDVLIKMKKLFLRNNQISVLPVTVMRGICKNLDMLDLGTNQLIAITEGTFETCSKLETLKLEGNRLAVLHPLYQKSLADLRLLHNPLKCSCENEALLKWLQFAVIKLDNPKCVSGELLIKMKLTSCSAPGPNMLSLSSKVFVPILVLLSVIGVMFGIVFRFRYEIQVIVFYKWNIRFKFCCMKADTEIYDYTYDIFVCFAEEDVSFVKGSLMHLLEPKYKVCIYYRDFPLGEYIAEAILKAIDESKMIIIVLSESFIRSRWGTFEFRNAHFAAIRNENKKLMVILLNNEVLKMKLDLTLRSILYTNAYLSVDDDLFTEKLLHSMPEIPVGTDETKGDEQLRTVSGYCDDTSPQRTNVENINDTIDVIF